MKISNSKKRKKNRYFLQVSWSTLTLSSIFFAAHLLVCFNSAVNPILYALINRELRQQHTKALIKRCRSLSNATNSALDALIKHSQQSRSPIPTKMKIPHINSFTEIGYSYID
ncbi:unnamed protein product [Onchocerca flexuosa]|uniref:G_PROTEIN_RECEP_F1_2 domain-containing protein n=1 Tax=Onchocerca flexuosa TaxID=387005 RepID=A0A183HTX3_9BILA|nr:unnamed protein product [Onchocerca flexuosa]